MSKNTPELKLEDVGLCDEGELSVDTLNSVINELMARITVLEDQQTVIVDGYEWIANETRQLFGMNHLARVFDAIYIKLTAKDA